VNRKPVVLSDPMRAFGLIVTQFLHAFRCGSAYCAWVLVHVIRDVDRALWIFVAALLNRVDAPNQLG